MTTIEKLKANIQSINNQISLLNNKRYGLLHELEMLESEEYARTHQVSIDEVCLGCEDVPCGSKSNKNILDVCSQQFNDKPR
jgi:hypothetical protein